MNRIKEEAGRTPFQAVLFDLDGTLTDPKEGITKSVSYALASFGIDEPDLDKLEPFIGPPLADSFMEFYGFTKEQAAKAVEKYRERFADTGIFENVAYDGIAELLGKLKGRGCVLAVASSKPWVFVERILDRFLLREYFDVVVGSELDGRRCAKEEVVEEALRQIQALEEGGRCHGGVDKGRIVMVGDRRYDIEGAKRHGLPSIGVSFGYGGTGELLEAGADYIAGSVRELSDLLLGEGADYC